MLFFGDILENYMSWYRYMQTPSGNGFILAFRMKIMQHMLDTPHLFNIAVDHSKVIQGTFGVIQGTFSVILGIFRVIQGTSLVSQGTFGAIQGTFGVTKETFGVLQVLSIMQNDVPQVSEATGLVIELYAVTCHLISITALLFMVNSQMAWMIIVWAPFIIAFNTWGSKRVMEISSVFRSEEKNSVSNMSEVLHNAVTVRHMGDIKYIDAISANLREFAGKLKATIASVRYCEKMLYGML
jgi:ABC-type multidrug transport system fused ATPase/permease subunit